MVLFVRRKWLIAFFLVLAGTYLCLTWERAQPLETFQGKICGTVIVDAGHGDPDGGAVSKGGTIESELNLAVATKLEEELTERGYRVIMTRTGSEGIFEDSDASLRAKKKDDMYRRLDIMNEQKADLFVSIHMNQFSSAKYRGAEVLYSSNFAESALLAELIQTELRAINPSEQTRSAKEAEKSIFLLKHAPLPAVLVECGFLSNPDEEKLLCDRDYQARLAAAICQGVLEFYKSSNHEEIA